MELLWLIVLGTAIGVGVDASSNKIRAGLTKGLFDMGPLGWFLACLLIWIIAFPAYLVKRPELIAAAKTADQLPSGAPGPWPSSGPPGATSAAAPHAVGPTSGSFPDLGAVAPATQNFCSSCGTKLHADASYCHGCGRTLQ